MSTSPSHSLPRVAIVGRPNVGKSTLLNRMCGSRVAIVEPTAGVTRDRVSVPVRLPSDDGPRWIEVIDTGGVGIVDRDDLGPHVESQIQTALHAADLVLFVVDVRDGLTPLDQEVARRLRGLPIPVLLVVNKNEGRQLEWDVDVFYRLGVGEELFGISAQNGLGLHPLYEAMLQRLPGAPSERPEERNSMKLAVVGRRNAGKSTLINQWAREERMIVSEVPGTTRDAVDVLFERGGETFIAIDSAGLRKPSKVADAVEFFSEARSRKTVRRADVVILMFDVTEPISSIEKRLARYVVDHHKPVILAANKWDLVKDLSPEDFRDYLDKELPGLFFAPILFLSAKNNERADQLLRLGKELVEQAAYRVPTGELNRVLEKALEARSPSSRGYRVRMRYATQAESSPPTFILFVNDKNLISKDYIRYLQNRIREELPFAEVPVRIVLRDSSDEFEPKT
ncbi:MAG: ribosome biogenesis GTPase Der [Planctomycetes bacterium]|nr:ribosome biogenesis GTPase Der [Planctomycetota bacterium]HRV80461.1 ribosome biogenesis GTPase Der [Planctomycetota bacterium]